MKLIVTIDTEEDNWSRYSAIENPVKNIERIIPLQLLFDRFEIKPTYLITYPVATNPRSVAIMKSILEKGKCEIGMHCHPWNTPPFNANQVVRKHESMLCNLSEEIQFAKLASLHEAITKNLGVVPVSFRAGRFGFGIETARSLCRLGYRIDTSITPFTSWKQFHGPDFSNFGPELFRCDGEGRLHKDGKGELLEVPVTIGFLQSNFPICRFLMKVITKPFIRNVHLAKIFEHSGLLNKVWLSPELADGKQMIRLSERMIKNRYACLNMIFHSSSLLNGLSPFVRSMADENKFFQYLREVLMFSRTAGWESVTLSQFEQIYVEEAICSKSGTERKLLMLS